MGTNAFPFLLAQAFKTNQNSGLQALLSKAAGFLPSYWNASGPLTQQERSQKAVEILCSCKPDTMTLFPSLVNALDGTDPEMHLRAVKLLGSGINPVPATVSYLARDLANPMPFIGVEAFQSLLVDRAKAKMALPYIISTWKTPNLTQFQYSYDLKIIGSLDNDAAEAVPALENAFNGATNCIVRCDIAKTLVKVSPHESDFVVPLLKQRFHAEADWWLRLQLAETIFHLETNETNAFRFLVQAWQTATNYSQRHQLKMLWPFPRDPSPFLIPTNSPDWGIALSIVQFQNPPYERWLELGKDVESPTGPTVEQWVAMNRQGQPQYHGRSLQQWLESAAPIPSPQDTVGDIDEAKALCEDAIIALGTNAIPCLMTWLQSTNQQYKLARRGFRILGARAATAMPALAQMTETNVPALRTQAYNCLKALELDWASIWPALVPVLHNPDPSIRRQAASFLCQYFPNEAEQAGLKEFIQTYYTSFAPR